MRRHVLPLAAFCVGLGGLLSGAHADGILKKHHSTPPHCEPGYKIVEETVMQEVTRTVCKMVPETKKKWVYSTIDDPFCIRDTRHGECPNCSGPYCRKLLVKTHVEVPCPGLKCVTETITEVVPVKVYRKVPCGPTESKIETIPAPPKKN